MSPAHGGPLAARPRILHSQRRASSAALVSPTPGTTSPRTGRQRSRSSATPSSGKHHGGAAIAQQQRGAHAAPARSAGRRDLRQLLSSGVAEAAWGLRVRGSRPPWPSMGCGRAGGRSLTGAGRQVSAAGPARAASRGRQAQPGLSQHRPRPERGRAAPVPSAGPRGFSGACGAIPLPFCSRTTSSLARGCWQLRGATGSRPRAHAQPLA
jgi:hypothetical protein